MKKLNFCISLFAIPKRIRKKTSPSHCNYKLSFENVIPDHTLDEKDQYPTEMPLFHPFSVICRLW